MSETPKKQRLVICRGVYCNEGRRADQNFRLLKPLLDELNGQDYPPRIKVEIAICLNMCGAGPNIIIYPAGSAFNGVDAAMIPHIVDEHLR